MLLYHDHRLYNWVESRVCLPLKEHRSFFLISVAAMKLLGRVFSPSVGLISAADFVLIRLSFYIAAMITERRLRILVSGSSRDQIELCNLRNDPWERSENEVNGLKTP